MSWTREQAEEHVRRANSHDPPLPWSANSPDRGRQIGLPIDEPEWSPSDDTPRGKHYVEPRGHADRPGTGPAGETCGSCRHRYRNELQSKAVYKCSLVEWTNGRATDILLRHRACSRWEEEREP